ncbi:hypothetical protein [Lewinella sp. W8]|uniref:hypothetical protein n=1 Tax=Lewinella sp. W8 TaxID=2528208 RepID=UPI0010676E8A|nr:hypothetical protein [Lewinella sp. W8]MTB49609.1 hypothetical protein [Lewinella sp. W8]
MKSFLTLFLLLTTLAVWGQLPTSPELTTFLDSLDVRLYQPFDVAYKAQAPTDNDYLEDHARFYSREEKLEIRLHFRAEDARDPYYGMPHLRAGHLVMNLGSNDEDAVTSVHSFGEEEMMVFNADWARLFTFRPKRSYSERSQAQLIALYREGRGMVYLVLLFDRPPGNLEDRQLLLGFRAEDEG